MKGRIILFFEGLLFVSCIMFSCKGEIEYVDKIVEKTVEVEKEVEVEKIVEVDRIDEIPPGTINELVALGAENTVLLTWKNPDDEDFFGTKICFSPESDNVMQPIIIEGTPNESSKAIFTGLENETEYTFFLTSIDKSQNKSETISTQTTTVSSFDFTSPSNVTNLEAKNKGAAILLTWTDATDDDIFGYEITYSTSNGEYSNNKYIIVSQQQEVCHIRGLTNGISYIFCVKTIDLTGNKSSGVSITAVPEYSTLNIELSIPDNLSNTVVPVTAKITSTAEITKVVYKKNGSENPIKLLSDLYSSEATYVSNDLWQFSADEKTYWTVAAEDVEGRQQTAQIYVNTIDKIPLADVSDICSKFNFEDNSVEISYTEPVPQDSFDSPVDFIYVTYSIEDGTEIHTPSSIAQKGNGKIVISELSNTVDYYIFNIYVVDTVGNISSGTTTRVDVVIYANEENIIEKINSMTSSAKIILSGELSTSKICFDLQQAIKNLDTDIFIELDMSSVSAIYDHMTFKDCKQLKRVVLPDWLEYLGESAFFANCTNLESVVLGSQLKRIWGSDFAGCVKLKEITIPSSVTIISKRAFYGCSSLRTITIPNSVTAIYWGVFDDCENLTGIIFEDTTSNWYSAISKRGSSNPIDYNFTNCIGNFSATNFEDNLNKVQENTMLNPSNYSGNYDGYIIYSEKYQTGQ